MKGTRDTSTVESDSAMNENGARRSDRLEFKHGQEERGRPSRRKVLFVCKNENGSRGFQKGSGSKEK